MRILIVEDSKERTDFLLRQCVGHKVAVAPTAREAIKLLGETTFDLLFLDHNLADSSGNGLDVARHLRTLGREATPAILHSEDITAAQAMASLLPRSRVYPFFQLKELAGEHKPPAWITKCLAMSGMRLHLSNSTIINLSERPTLGGLPKGHLWIETPNLTASPPPYSPEALITLDTISAPAPKTPQQGMEFVRVLLEDPNGEVFWGGDWMDTFHDTHTMSASDRDAWLAWRDSNEQYLNEVLSLAQMQAHCAFERPKKHDGDLTLMMMGTRVPAKGIGSGERTERTPVFYDASEMARRHRLPSTILQEDYEFSLTFVANDSTERGMKCVERVMDRNAPYSILAVASDGASCAVKVTVVRAPDEPTCSKAQIRALQGFCQSHSRRAYIAPVGIAPLPQRDEDGYQVFGVKYDGLFPCDASHFSDESEVQNPAKTGATLSEEDALRAYARMLNRLDVECVVPLLAEDLRYSSEWRAQVLSSKTDFLNFMREKCQTMKRSGVRVWAELAEVRPPGRPCLLMAQRTIDNVNAAIFINVKAGNIQEISLRSVPPLNDMRRTGEYPT